MLSAFPCIAADEFAQSCQSLESRCQDFLEGTEWLSVEWDQNALYIKKKCKIEGQVEHNGSPNLKSEDEQFVDAETEEVGFLPLGVIPGTSQLTTSASM